MSATLLLGITGGIASGKSTVDGMLAALGAAPIIDADVIVHDLLAHDAGVQAAIAARFGDALVISGAVNRRALGAIVFADAAALRDLEAITHPAVRARIAAQVATLPGGGIAVVDAVKLLQGPLAALCTRRWWVRAEPAQQVERLMQSRGMSRADALRRVAAAPRLEEWRYQVDIVIDNSGPLEETHRQVQDGWTHLSQRE